MALRNIRNALAEPRLVGRLQKELVTYMGGTAVFRKDQPCKKELG